MLELQIILRNGYVVYHIRPLYYKINTQSLANYSLVTI